MRIFPCIAVSLVITAGVSWAASFSVDFDEAAYPIPDGVNPTPSIDGIDGWNQSVPTPNGETYAWISTSFSSGNSLTYGGYLSELPPSISVGRTFSGLAAGEKSLSFQSHITDIAPPDPIDPVAPIPGRDIFGFQIRGEGGDLLLTVNLVPDNQTYVASGDPGGFAPALWTVYYAFGSGTPITKGNSVQSTGVGSFSVDFGADGLTFNYGQGSNGPFSDSGTASGYDVNDTEIDLTFTYERSDLDDEYTGGENHIRIDNINVIDGIPEPTTAALAALGSLALLRRRRVQ